jgi:IMP cyclohydrolase
MRPLIERKKIGYEPFVIYSGARIARITQTEILAYSGFTLKAGVYLVKVNAGDAKGYVITVPDVGGTYEQIGSFGNKYNTTLAQNDMENFYASYVGSFKEFRVKYQSPNSSGGQFDVGHLEFLGPS